MNAVVDLGRPLHAAPVLIAEAGLDDLGRRVVAVRRGEVLAFLGQQPVPLQVPVDAEVADDVEGVEDLLQRAPGLLAPVPAVLHVGVEHRLPPLLRHVRRQLAQP